MSLASKIFELRDTELLDRSFLDVVTENNLKLTSSKEFFYEDFLQYNKTGQFLIDCGFVIEFYIYYIVGCILLKILYKILKKVCNPTNVLLINLRNINEFFVSRHFLFRIFNETYSYVLLYGLYMELNVHFPLRDNKNGELLVLNYFHIVLSKVLQRIMLTGVGFGFPAYLISRIIMFGKGEKINTDL